MFVCSDRFWPLDVFSDIQLACQTNASARRRTANADLPREKQANKP
jgi:hypothetical protein